MLFCELSCIVGVKVDQGYGKIMKIEVFLRTKKKKVFREKNRILNYSQNLPNMGGESFTVLRLRLMRKLAMSLNVLASIKFIVGEVLPLI